MQLWEKSAFNLDDDVSKYLGYTLRNPLYPNTAITFRMLLTHQTGLQLGPNYAKFLSDTLTTKSGVYPKLKDLLTLGGSYYSSLVWTTWAPGTYFSISDMNFGIIGTLIEAISGERFDIYMR